MSHEDDFVVDRRRVRRAPLDAAARIRPNEWSVAEVEVADVSRFGFRARCELLLKVGGFLSIELPGIGFVDAKVIWRREGEFGAKFIVPVDPRHCDWLKADLAPVADAAVPAVEQALALFRARMQGRSAEPRGPSRS